MKCAAETEDSSEENSDSESSSSSEEEESDSLDEESSLKVLELKLGEQMRMNEGQPPKIRMIYCIMCGKQGHVIHDCAESKFFLGQGICRMDLNNQVVMSDGSSLLHAEGDRGAAKMIRLKLAGASPAVPTSTSASNIEVTAAEMNLNDELMELAILGAMEFKVVPAEQTDKSKWCKQ